MFRERGLFLEAKTRLRSQNHRPDSAATAATENYLRSRMRAASLSADGVLPAKCRVGV